MATFQLPSAVDPAVRMALTQSGWSEEIFAWILCTKLISHDDPSITKNLSPVNGFRQSIPAASPLVWNRPKMWYAKPYHVILCIFFLRSTLHVWEKMI